MLKLNLAEVERGEAHLRESVPPDASPWDDLGIELSAPLEVDLRARSVGEGIFVRGTLRTTVRRACRRCLKEVEVDVDETVDLLYEPPSDEAPEDGEVYPLPDRGTELDLGDAVREHLLLRVPQFALCEEACRGLCPQCGANLNETSCDCEPEEAPSPWDALRKLKLD